MFPLFHITRSDSAEVFGSVTTTTFGSETWVGDARLGYLIADVKLIYGRWHVRGDHWGFVPNDLNAIQLLRPDMECAVLDGYWGERAELVLDSDRKWQKARNEGLDHDHCAICWETIGSGGQLDGYICEDATWTCCHCYEAFVQPRSLEFIPHSSPQ